MSSSRMVHRSTLLGVIVPVLMCWTAHLYTIDAFHPSQWRRQQQQRPIQHQQPQATRTTTTTPSTVSSSSPMYQPTRGTITTGNVPRHDRSRRRWNNDNKPPASATAPLSFQQRMLDELKQQDHRRNGGVRRPSKTGKNNPRLSKVPSFIHDIHTLDDFRDLFESYNNNNNSGLDMVLVWYYAPWCTSCHALRPGMEALARRHTTPPQQQSIVPSTSSCSSSPSSSVRVVQIACDETTVAIHKGLWDIPSVPYVQLYATQQKQKQNHHHHHPHMSKPQQPQLVLEMKLNRKKLNVLHKTLQDMKDGQCSLERLGQWDVSCPYSFPYYDSAVTTTTTTTTITTTSSTTSPNATSNRQYKQLKP